MIDEIEEILLLACSLMIILMKSNFVSFFLNVGCELMIFKKEEISSILSILKKYLAKHIFDSLEVSLIANYKNLSINLCFGCISMLMQGQKKRKL